MRNILVVLVLMVGCGSDEPAPSCQQAVGHFYSVGCRFIMANGTPYTEGDAIADCKATNAAVPDRCQGEFDDFMFCLDGVAGGGTAGCDCTQEQDALFGCQ